MYQWEHNLSIFSNKKQRHYVHDINRDGKVVVKPLILPCRKILRKEEGIWLFHLFKRFNRNFEIKIKKHLHFKKIIFYFTVYKVHQVMTNFNTSIISTIIITTGINQRD